MCLGLVVPIFFVKFCVLYNKLRCFCKSYLWRLYITITHQYLCKKFFQMCFQDTHTVWTGWISPILEDYCGNFYLMSVLFFLCICLVHQSHFMTSVQIFDIVKYFFHPKLGIILRGTPYKFLKMITLYLKNYSRYQNVMAKQF